jgi:hypothetical protein
MIPASGCGIAQSDKKRQRSVHVAGFNHCCGRSSNSSDTMLVILNVTRFYH